MDLFGRYFFVEVNHQQGNISRGNPADSRRLFKVIWTKSTKLFFRFPAKLFQLLIVEPSWNLAVGHSLLPVDFGLLTGDVAGIFDIVKDLFLNRLVRFNKFRNCSDDVSPGRLRTSQILFNGDFANSMSRQLFPNGLNALLFFLKSLPATGVNQSKLMCQWSQPAIGIILP